MESVVLYNPAIAVPRSTPFIPTNCTKIRELIKLIAASNIYRHVVSGAFPAILAEASLAPRDYATYH